MSIHKVQGLSSRAQLLTCLDFVCSAVMAARVHGAWGRLWRPGVHLCGPSRPFALVLRGGRWPESRRKGGVPFFFLSSFSFLFFFFLCVCLYNLFVFISFLWDILFDQIKIN